MRKFDDRSARNRRRFAGKRSAKEGGRTGQTVMRDGMKWTNDNEKRKKRKKKEELDLFRSGCTYSEKRGRK